MDPRSYKSWSSLSMVAGAVGVARFREVAPRLSRQTPRRCPFCGSRRGDALGPRRSTRTWVPAASPLPPPGRPHHCASPLPTRITTSRKPAYGSIFLGGWAAPDFPLRSLRTPCGDVSAADAKPVVSAELRRAPAAFRIVSPPTAIMQPITPRIDPLPCEYIAGDLSASRGPPASVRRMPRVDVAADDEFGPARAKFASLDTFASSGRVS
jgi:hypothetical protein